MKLINRFALGCLVLLIAASAFAQYQTGNIYGKVVSNDGSGLVGVTVTLTGIGAPQTFVTDGEGNFRFLNLSPGIYSLKAELEGLGSTSKSGIEVNIGRNANVSLPLTPRRASRSRSSRLRRSSTLARRSAAPRSRRRN